MQIMVAVYVLMKQESSSQSENPTYLAGHCTIYICSMYFFFILCLLSCDKSNIWSRKNTFFSPHNPVPVITLSDGFCFCAFCFSYFYVDIVLYYHVSCGNNNIFGKIKYTRTITK